MGSPVSVYVPKKLLDGIDARRGRLSRSLYIVTILESTIMAYPIMRALRTHGYGDVTVAHPKTLAWIVRSKKNDRVVSLKIAKLHMAGMLPESHLLDKDEQIVRDLLIQGVKLGVEVGRLKSSLIGYLKREDVYNSLPRSEDNFSVRRRRAIRSLRFDDKRDLILGTMMDRLEFLERQCSASRIG
jgi:hypothetical protein